jgi:hypothetical protein
MRALLILLSVCFVLPAMADVYRWTDKDGVIHYTDKPPEPGAKPVDLPQLQTFKPDALPSLHAGPDAPPAAKTVKVSISISTPAAEETIRDGEGKVPVSVTAVPESGQGIIYTLDGAAQNKQPTPSSAYLLTGVERGEHSIGASLVDASGKTLATAAPVTIYMMPPTVKH